MSVKTFDLAIFLVADRVDGLRNSEHYIGYIPINLYTEAVLPGVEAHTVMGGLVVQGSDREIRAVRVSKITGDVRSLP